MPQISMPFLRNGEVSAGENAPVGSFDGFETGYLGISFGKAVEIQYKMPYVFSNQRPCTGGLTIDLGGLPDSRLEGRPSHQHIMPEAS